MNKAVKHLRQLWGNWWLLPFAPLLFLLFVTARGEVRVEHVIIVAISTLLALANARTQAFLIAILPGLAIVVGYEAVRYLRPIFVVPERILGCEIRAIEMALFSFGGKTTLPDYFAQHHAPVFDLFFALPYTAFWGVAVAYAVFLYFYDRSQMTRYLWLLVAVHAVSFVIWMAVPAAPPWYVQAYGCVIDPAALPSSAALARVDQLLGITYYESFYSRAPTVFGALPSLHCAFPMAGLLAAWRSSGWPVRLVHLTYSIWMIAASVYLVHHWLLDGVLAVVIVLCAHLLLTRLSPQRAKAAGKPSA